MVTDLENNQRYEFLRPLVTGWIGKINQAVRPPGF